MQSTPPGEPSPFDDGEFDTPCAMASTMALTSTSAWRRGKSAGPRHRLWHRPRPVARVESRSGRRRAGPFPPDARYRTPEGRRPRVVAGPPPRRHGRLPDAAPHALITITFNAFCHMLTTDDQVRRLACIRRHLLPGGLLAFDGAFPGLAWIGAPQNQRELEAPDQAPANR